MKLTLLAALLGCSLSAYAIDDGTDRGNPGDEYSKAFTSLAYDLAESLAKDPILDVNARELLAAIRKTTVRSEDVLRLGEYEVDALNFPHPETPLIKLSRRGWDRMQGDPRRAFLVLHEYLSIMGLDDSKYQISSLLDRANVCSRTPAVRAVIERELKKSCFRIIPDDLQYVVSAWLADKELGALKNSDFSGLIGLENLYLQGNPILSVDLGFFSRFPHLDSFDSGYAIKDLSDCSLFGSAPLLRHMSIGATNRGTISERPDVYQALKGIGPSCFTRLDYLKSLALGMNGEKTVLHGFLRGLTRGVSLRLEGKQLDKIPPSEFENISLRDLTFLSYDHRMPEEFKKAISKAANFGGISESEHKSTYFGTYYVTSFSRIE